LDAGAWPSSHVAVYPGSANGPTGIDGDLGARQQLTSIGVASADNQYRIPWV
jgi:hypothetical protein